MTGRDSKNKDKSHNKFSNKDASPCFKDTNVNYDNSLLSNNANLKNRRSIDNLGASFSVAPLPKSTYVDRDKFADLIDNFSTKTPDHHGKSVGHAKFIFNDTEISKPQNADTLSLKDQITHSVSAFLYNHSLDTLQENKQLINNNDVTNLSINQANLNRLVNELIDISFKPVIS